MHKTMFNSAAVAALAVASGYHSVLSAGHITIPVEGGADVMMRVTPRPLYDHVAAGVIRQRALAMKARA